jgi:hypothetical protein
MFSGAIKRRLFRLMTLWKKQVRSFFRPDSGRARRRAGGSPGGPRAGTTAFASARRAASALSSSPAAVIETK